MEFKTMPIHVKDIEPKKGIFTGYASTFGVVDDGDPPDIVEKGAFSKSIQENGPDSKKPRIKCLYQHDFFSPIGIPMVLKEDDVGLYHETKVSQTTIGKDTLILIADGVITEQSIGYDTVKADMDNQGIRHLREVRLWEFSPVTWGMNPETPILGVKGLNASDSLAERIARAEKAIRRGDLSSEELVVALTKTLPLWRKELKRMNKDASGKANWPLAQRDHAWDSAAAHQRILNWATDPDGNVDWKKYASCHFWFDGSAPDPDGDGLPDRIGDYKLPFCDVINGEVMAVPRGIFAVAAVLQGSMGGVNIPESDVSAVKARVEAYYKRMADEFNDSSLVAPWNQKGGDPRLGLKIGRQYKAPDFNQLMAAQELSEVLFDMWYALREAIEGALFDETVPDKVSAVGTIVDQFKAAITAWTQQLVNVGALGSSDENEMQEAISALAGNGPGSAKAGRTISQANLEKMKQVHELMGNAHGMLGDLIEATSSSSSEPGSKGAHSGNEPDEQVVHSMKDLLAQMQAEAKKRGA